MFKKPNQYVLGLRDHWRKRRTLKTYTGRRCTAINDCWKPPAGTSKEDLAEYHAEEMKLRRRRQHARANY